LNNYPVDGTVANVKALIDIAVNFKNSRNVKVYCGEYGVYIPNSDSSDRAFWYQVVRQYLEEKGERFRRGGANQQQSLDMAVAEFLAELAPTVQIPNKVGQMVRNMLVCQSRFRKIPGRNPLSFIGRPGFGDALDYLRFTGEVTGENRKLSVWWEQFVRDNPQVALEETSGERHPKPEAGRRRKRRRRRRGQPPI